MQNHPTPLSDDERAELEELRAEKAQHEADERAQRERAELERLRSEKARREAKDSKSHAAPPAGERTVHKQQPTSRADAERRERAAEERERQRVEAIRDQHDAELRERGRELMEPDDDLRMPKGQKFVIAGVVVVVVILLLMNILGG